MRTSDWLADFRGALRSPKAALSRLAVVDEEAIALARELAMTEVARAARRREVYASSQESSVSGRDREADLHSADLIDEIIRMKGDLAAYSLERDHLRFFIEHGSVNAVFDELSPSDT